MVPQNREKTVTETDAIMSNLMTISASVSVGSVWVCALRFAGALPFAINGAKG